MEKSKRIVFIGNSIVNGFGVAKDECFCSLLESRFGYDTINSGINGDVTPNVLSRMDEDALAYKPDIIVLLSGTNDFIFNHSTSEEVFNNILAIARKAVSGGALFISMTPLLTDRDMAHKLWRVDNTDYGIVNRCLKETGDLIRNYDWSELGDAEYMDTQKAFAEYVAAQSPEASLVDGLHPKACGHEFLAGYISEEMEKLIDRD